MFPFYTNTEDDWTAELEKEYKERFVRETSTFLLVHAEKE